MSRARGRAGGGPGRALTPQRPVLTWTPLSQAQPRAGGPGASSGAGARRHAGSTVALPPRGQSRSAGPPPGSVLPACLLGAAAAAFAASLPGPAVLLGPFLPPWDLCALGERAPLLCPGCRFRARVRPPGLAGRRQRRCDHGLGFRTNRQQLEGLSVLSQLPDHHRLLCYL